MGKIACAGCALVLALAVRAEWKPAESTLMTEWGAKVTPANAWREYPRPQLVRPEWTNLNGLWKYAVTPKAADAARRPDTWDGEILVPFALEAPLSGVGRQLKSDELLWYTRKIKVEKKGGERILLHFGGVDFRAQVFIGHAEVTDVPHEGGLVPFTLDITPYVEDGENDLTLAVWDPTTDFVGATGKQVFNPGGCMYTRMSGIWQTVWMERVPATHITGYRTSGVDLAAGTVKLTVDGEETPADRKAGVKGVAVATLGGKEVAKAEFVFGETVTLKLPKPVRAWSPDSPALYGLKLAYGKDAATGYFAMRTFEKRRDVTGTLRFFLNGEPCFIQGPLDQGWWPDGLLTPPSEEAMKFDIRTLKDLGFNMMRKHIKVEPARYYWLCDTLGMMVVQDMASGAGDVVKRYGCYRMELKDMVDALRVFPSIVMWCPYNEGWGQPGEFLTHCTLDWVRRYDPDRLVNGPSGWNDFEGGGGKGSNVHKPAGECEAADSVDRHIYRGPGMLPVNDRRVSFLGEFGGLGHPVEGHLWNPASKQNWGYGGTKDTATREGLQKAYLGLIDRLAGLARRGLGGSVYTQTTDVELEMNGFLTYDRKVLKFDKQVLRKAHEAVYAAAEKAAKWKSVRTDVFPRNSEWAWTAEKPAEGWNGAAFDDSAWARGKGMFGANVGALPFATRWTGKELWLRRAFTVKNVESADAVIFDMFHDEDTEVYVNGVQVFSVTGYNTDYEPFELKLDAFRKALKSGENVIAVHVTQTEGGQGFDAALQLERIVR